MSEKVRGVNISESVGVSVEALSILKLDIARDKEFLAERLEKGYSHLVNDQPRPGELFPHLPLKNDYQLFKLLETIDSREYAGREYKYPKTQVWHHGHWVHGAVLLGNPLMKVDRYAKNHADIRNIPITARLALSDSGNKMFPYNHHGNKPYDHANVTDEDKDSDRITQLEAFNNEQAIFELENPNFDMFTIDVASYALLTLQRRIKGQAWPIPLGVMRLPDLGRSKDEFGKSVVSIVHTSAIGQIGLGMSDGERSSATGFGESIASNKYLFEKQFRN
jgi:hypothetical protein